MQFDFIHDRNFKALLERDYEEIGKCIEAKAAKSVLLLCGSIIEAVLSDYFIEHLPTSKNKNDILKAPLAELLELAEGVALISKKDKQLAIIIKDYRNLIHPGKEIRNQEDFDWDTAALSKILLDMILKKIRNLHLENYNYTSKDIIEKLINHWEFHAVYGMIITQLDHNEKEKLFTSLIDMETQLKSNFEHFNLNEPAYVRKEIDFVELSNIKDKIQLLKPLINPDLITSILQDLKKAVVSGESVRILSLYNLFHEEMILLPARDQETIAAYMLSLFESIFENARELASEKTYSTIGKYLKSADAVARFKEFSTNRIVNFGSADTVEYEAEVYQQMLNSFPTEIQKEVLTELEMFLPDSRDELERSHITLFYDELVRRKIVPEKYR